MTKTTEKWRKMAAQLREDAEGCPVEGATLLHAAACIETAAETFDSRYAALLAEAFGTKP